MKHCFLSVGFVLLLPIAHADIVQCIDENRETVFRETKCDENEDIIKRFNKKEFENKNPTPSRHYDIQTNSALGKNLLLNASFENKLIDWRVPLGSAWTINGGVNGSGALIIQAQKPPDDSAIYETAVEQCIRLGPGEKFKIAAQFRFDKPPLKRHANRVNVIWYESLDCTIGGQWGSYLEPTNSTGWQKLSRNNLTPALGAKAVKIRIVQNGRYSNNGRAFWDNMVFTVSEIFERSIENSKSTSNSTRNQEPGFNFVLNGSFDVNLDSWHIGWKTVWSDLEGRTSKGSARVTAKSTSGSIGRSAFSQCDNFGNNTRFELGANFKFDSTSNQNGSARLRVTWYEKQNCFGRAKTDTKSSDPIEVAGWQKLLVSGLKSPENSHSARIEIIQSISGAGEFYAFWDDIYFISTQ